MVDSSYVAGPHAGVGAAIILILSTTFNGLSGKICLRCQVVCCYGASGVIGNELFMPGRFQFSRGDLATLQIYDIAARTWRLGRRYQMS